MPYVDVLTGLQPSQTGLKAAVDCTTTASVALYGLVACDGFTPAQGGRVLVKNQTDLTQNGIYTASTGAWTRAPDFDGSGEVAEGTFVFVRHGTLFGGQYFRQTCTDNPIVVGTSLLAFAPFALVLTGSQGIQGLPGVGAGDTLTFATKATFASAIANVIYTATIASANWVRVEKVVAEGANYSSSALTYKRSGASTGLYGELGPDLSGAYWTPQYSTFPVDAAQFGMIGDAVFTETAALLSGTANGTTTLNLGVSITGNTASNTTVSNVSSFTGVYVGATISGSGIPGGTTIASMDPGAATITLSAAATLTASGVAITTKYFAGTAPVNGQNICDLFWNTLGTGALTISAYVAGTSITLSGTMASGVHDLVTWATTLTGTDNQPILQAAIDFALQRNLPDIKVPRGKFRMANTVQAGYGDTYSTVRLFAGERSFYQGTGGATAFYHLLDDRPLINFQGARASGMRGISVIGPNNTYGTWAQFYSNRLSSNPFDWLAPTLHKTGANPGGLQRYSALSGITIDAVAGTAPSAPYPSAAFPAPSWAPGTPLYGRSLSSGVTIEKCETGGWGVGFNCEPNQDQQGDYIVFRDCIAIASPYLVSAGNGQCRGFELRTLNFAGCHTVITSSTFGNQTGEIGNAVIENLVGGGCYQLCDITNLGTTGSLAFNGVYIENGVRIGRIASGASASGSVSISNAQFGFTEYVHGQIPAAYIESSIYTSLTLGDIEIAGSNRITSIASGSPEIVRRGGLYYGGYNMGGSVGTAAKQRALTFTGGIFLGDVFLTNSKARLLGGVRYASMDVAPASATAGLQAQSVSEIMNLGNARRAARVQDTRAFIDTQGKEWRFVLQPQATVILTSGAGYTSVAAASTKDVMTFTYLNVFQTNAVPGYRIEAGDLLLHDTTKTLFMVASVAVSGSDWLVTCIQQNNMTTYGLTDAFLSNTNVTPLLPGTTYIIKTGGVISKQVNYGTFTSGSKNVTAITHDGTSGADLTTDLINGDLLYGMTYPGVTYKQWPVPAVTTLSAVANGSPGTLSLADNAVASGTFPLLPFPSFS